MSVFESVIGWLAPPVCVGCGVEGSALCEACGASELLPFGERCYKCSALSPRSRTCPAHRTGSPRYVWISTDYGGAAKVLLQKYKFNHLRTAANPLSAHLAATLRTYNDSNSLAKAGYLVVAVPTASGRVRERGFDHAALLAKTTAGRLALAYSPLLARLGQARQVGATRAQRMAQQTGTYRVTRPYLVAGRNILLIDDVVTTGATLRAATAALRAAGARHVDALVFAKSL